MAGYDDIDFMGWALKINELIYSKLCIINYIYKYFEFKCVTTLLR